MTFGIETKNVDSMDQAIEIKKKVSLGRKIKGLDDN